MSLANYLRARGRYLRKRANFADRLSRNLNVRFGSKADIPRVLSPSAPRPDLLLKYL